MFLPADYLFILILSRYKELGCSNVSRNLHPTYSRYTHPYGLGTVFSSDHHWFQNLLVSAFMSFNYEEVARWTAILTLNYYS
nr:MAG TPA: hypothetical protein [Caudoviricetes sp.]